jgi:hypothetical protein
MLRRHSPALTLLFLLPVIALRGVRPRCLPAALEDALQRATVAAPARQQIARGDLRECSRSLSLRQMHAAGPATGRSPSRRHRTRGHP